MSYSPIIDSIQIPHRCKKVGHDNQPLNFVCLLPNLPEHLFCSNCLLTDQAQNEKQMQSYKTFLENHLTNERDLASQIAKNKQYVPIFADPNNELEIIKREEDRVIDELFNNLSKQMRVLLDNTKEKFKYFFKSHSEKIYKTVEEIKELETRNILPPLKDLLAKTNFSDPNATNKLFELLLKNQIALNRNIPQMEELMTKIPRLSNEKFKKAESDILAYTKERLKKLLELHVYSGYSLVYVIFFRAS